MSTFRPFTYRLPSLQHLEPADKIYGPPVIVVGWIPYHAPSLRSGGADSPDLTKFSYTASRWRRWLAKFAAKAMFSTGNPDPPISFKSQDSLVDFVGEGEFRGVLALDSVVALRDRSGRFIGVEGLRLGAVGCTPLRARPGGRRLLCFGSGEGKIAYSVLPNQRLTVHTWQTFKMGQFVDLGNALLTGSRATSARIEVAYVFDIDGSIEVRLTSSSIPSQLCALEWSEDAEIVNDMMKVNQSEIVEFFKAGACQSAPFIERRRYPATGQVLSS